MQNCQFFFPLFGYFAVCNSVTSVLSLTFEKRQYITSQRLLLLLFACSPSMLFSYLASEIDEEDMYPPPPRILFCGSQDQSCLPFKLLIFKLILYFLMPFCKTVVFDRNKIHSSNQYSTNIDIKLFSLSYSICVNYLISLQMLLINDQEQ